MRDESVGQGPDAPKMGVGKALGAIAALAGIALAFVFCLAAIIKWVAA